MLSQQSLSVKSEPSPMFLLGAQMQNAATCGDGLLDVLTEADAKSNRAEDLPLKVLLKSPRDQELFSSSGSLHNRRVDTVLLVTTPQSLKPTYLRPLYCTPQVKALILTLELHAAPSTFMQKALQTLCVQVHQAPPDAQIAAGTTGYQMLLTRKTASSFQLQ